MNSLSLASLIFFACLALITAQNASRAFCITGSSLYEKITLDCTDKDPTYTGEWYCSTIEVCESYISRQRDCIKTRGCSTQTECADSSSPTGVYDNTKIEVTSGILPAGMTITASCCKAYIPDYDDDAVAVDYASICNTASNSSNGFAGLALTVTAALVALYFLQ